MSESALSYEELGLTTGINSRVGVLHTPIGDYAMPAVAPGIRTRTDIEAVLQNRNHGMELPVITPYASYRGSIGPTFAQRFFPQGLDALVTTRRPLVIVDPEFESLSFSSVARLQFASLDRASSSGPSGPAIQSLMQTGFRTDPKYGTQEARVAWNQITRQFGLTSILNWAERHQRASKADVFLLPTPIMRADAGSVREALEIGMQMLPSARASPRFTMHGIALLILGEMFGPTDAALEARAALLAEVGRWHGAALKSGLFLSVKVYDMNKSLTTPPAAGIARRNLSEVLVGLHEAVQRSGGVLVAQDVGSLALGYIDSGADIAVEKLSGMVGIERPITGVPGPKGSRPMQNITLPREMVEEDYRKVKATFEETGGYPVPECCDPLPYWDFPKWTDRQVHATRSKCGTFVELASQYRKDATTPGTTLREAVRSRVNDSRLKQELIDLCPSI